VPAQLPSLIRNPKAMQAIVKMKKIDQPSWNAQRRHECMTLDADRPLLATTKPRITAGAGAAPNRRASQLRLLS